VAVGLKPDLQCKCLAPLSAGSPRNRFHLHFKVWSYPRDFLGCHKRSPACAGLLRFQADDFFELLGSGG
jgi:hypothetical protein